MQKFKAIFLDVDGVLLDSLDHGIRAHQKIAEKRGLPVPTAQEIISCWGLVFEKYLEILSPGLTREQYYTTYQQCGFDQEVLPEILGANETVRRLCEQYPLALISNRTRESLLDHLRAGGFLAYPFESIQSSDDTRFHKPDSRVFDNILSGMGLQPNETIFVGDTLIDYRSTLGTDIQFVAVTTGPASYDTFLAAGLPATEILDSIARLPNWLDR